VRGWDAVFHASIIACMAGAEAERLIVGDPFPYINADSGDRRHIHEYRICLSYYVSESVSKKRWDDKIEPRLRAMTRMLIRRHRALIERVAQALLDEKVLTRSWIDELAGRSVDDVQVNAPDLLAQGEREREAQEAWEREEWEAWEAIESAASEAEGRRFGTRLRSRSWSKT
jgi:hypothetical protein